MPAQQKTAEHQFDFHRFLDGYPPSKGRRQALARQHPFRIPDPPPGVVPSHARDKLTGKLAQDEYTDTLYGWAGGEAGIHAWIEEGLAFLGYPILSEMAQRAEYRIFSEVIAEDMTRRWVDLKGAGNKAKDEKVKRFADAVTKYELPHVFRTVAEYDGWFGRGHIYPDLKTPSGKWVYDDEEELKTPIGNGRDITSRTKVTKDSLKGFRVLEATWTYPGYYNSTDPLRPDWYRPENWYVMSRTVHHSRLLTIIGRPVPDILKPAYAFGGLSMSQMAKPYVDNWLQTRQSVNQIVHSFSLFGLKTNLMALLASGGHRLSERAETLCSLRDNTNLAVIDKETEDIFNISAPLGGLHELQSQAQEHMFSVARIPGVKFAGIQPSGLNASSEGEIRVYYDTIKGRQERMFRKPLTTCLDWIQLSEFGEIDEELTFDFVDLWQLDEAAQAAVQAQKAATHAIYVNDIAAVSPEEVRQAVAADPAGPYGGLDIGDTPPPQPDPMEAMMGGEGGQGGKPKAPLTNPLSERLERQGEEFGSPETGGFSAKDDEEVDDLLPVDAYFLARG